MMKQTTFIIVDGNIPSTGKYHVDILAVFNGVQLHISGRGNNRKKALQDLINRIIKNYEKK